MSPVDASMLNSSGVMTDLIHLDRGCTTCSTLSMWRRRGGLVFDLSGGVLVLCLGGGRGRGGGIQSKRQGVGTLSMWRGGEGLVYNLSGRVLVHCLCGKAGEGFWNVLCTN